ncbi:type VI lipase adapter Tla3 domain-containing protein [Azoarcus indigens]|nr:DUF2875 family protein [Azoarcus indigens]
MNQLIRFVVLLLCWPAGAIAEAPPVISPTLLAAQACPLPSALQPDMPKSAIGSTTARPLSPSLRLETLDIVGLGLSLDVYRQGQAWARLRKQDTDQPDALRLGTALPLDPRDYPTDGTRMDMAWEQRISNALELALQGFPERWPLPTVTVVRDYDPRMERPRVPPQDMEESLTKMVSRELGPAGLHWHRIRQLDHGVICKTDPEALLETLFQLFEQHPDLPALMVYALDSFNMRAALSSKNVSLDSISPPGARLPDTPTDAVVALVVARPERLAWLREFARYTKAEPGSIDPAFKGWARTPPRRFQPTPFFPEPITQRGLAQWDRLKVLARLHRPVTVSLPQGKAALKGSTRDKALAMGWDQAAAGLPSAPARVFFDTGRLSGGTAQLAPALHLAQQPIDILDAQQSYDLSLRVGDIGAASPFVGIALATMASYLNADSSLVVPLRQANNASFIGVSSPNPGKPPADDPFGVSLRPQHSAVTDEPSPEFQSWLARLEKEYQTQGKPDAPFHRDPDLIAAERHILESFISSAPGIASDEDNFK